MTFNKNKLLFDQETNLGQIKVWQYNNQRWLTINAFEQSRIFLEYNEKQLSPLHQAFLSALMFINTPEKVLLAGLGGGALARYFHFIKPEMKGDGIEKEKIIANLAKQFFEYPKSNWTIKIEDIKHYQGNDYDFIITDIADNDVTPSWLTSTSTLMKFKSQLSKNGVLVINLLVDNDQSFINALKPIRNTFNRRTLCLAVPGCKNIVVLAFNHLPHYYLRQQLSLRTKKLTEIWGINFDELLTQLTIDNPENNGLV